MKKKTLFILMSMVVANVAYSQSKKQQDINSIKEMCGCFEVGFNFAETFSYAKDSTYVPSAVKHDSGLEWVTLVADSDDELVLQHILIAGRPDSPMIIKHWRQDWIYENTNFHHFYADNTWIQETKISADVKGQWTQKVYQVDDSPRYQGTASWVHVDGRSYWNNTTDAPLPRREYTKRSDYNVLLRNNMHEITNDGWIHEQDNKKIIRSDGNDVILAEEKGFNSYIRVDDSRCIAAKNWWEENHEVWEKVRLSWDKTFEKNTRLSLKSQVDGKRLYEELFALDTKASGDDALRIIERFTAN